MYRIVTTNNEFETYMSFGYIFFLVTINYYTNRFVCKNYEIPYDCIQKDSLYDKHNSLSNLCIYILLLYYLNNLQKIHKHKFITKIFFIIITLVSGISFSYISSFEILRSSLQFGKGFDLNNNIIVIYLVLLILPVIILLGNFFYNKPSFHDIFSRLFLIGWFVLWCFLIYQENENIKVHAHHIFFSLIFCVLFYQKNLIIRIIFFISLGIFIQGFSNYNYDGLITFYKLINKTTYIYKYQYNYHRENEYLCLLCNDICM